MNSHHELKRQIGLRTATALVVGEVIAVGIFLTPAGMAKSLGSPLWLLVVRLAMGSMAVCGALCLRRTRCEISGKPVVAMSISGRPVAFLYGWMALLVMDPGFNYINRVADALGVGRG